MEMIETFRSGLLFTFFRIWKKEWIVRHHRCRNRRMYKYPRVECVQEHSCVWSSQSCDVLARAIHSYSIDSKRRLANVLNVCGEWMNSFSNLFTHRTLSRSPSLSRSVWNTFDAVRVLTNQCVDCVFYVWYSVASSFIPCIIDCLPVYMLFRIWLQWQ